LHYLIKLSQSKDIGTAKDSEKKDMFLIQNSNLRASEKSIENIREVNKMNIKKRIMAAEWFTLAGKSEKESVYCRGR
jgi:hypothetical protein